MNTLGLILARGGSKRIPHKNLRSLGPFPLLIWTIRAARLSYGVTDTVVSSDDEEILGLAKKYTATALRRPDCLATDEASSYPSILHALNSSSTVYSHVCLLQPTSPFRNAEDIDRALDMAADVPAVVSREEGKTVPNGAIYVANVSWLRETLARGTEMPFDTEVPLFYEMPSCRSVDIDEEIDLMRAQAMLEKGIVV